MSEQVDIAVDLGVVAPLLPEILSLRQLSPTCRRQSWSLALMPFGNFMVERL